MQKVLVHVAMVLLGVSLAVGFYEGRRLVKNTAKALTAASTLSTTGGRQQAREARTGDDEDAETDAEALADPASRKPKIDPSQLGAARLRARPPIAVGAGEPGDPNDPHHRAKRGGRRDRRAAKAERLGLVADPAARLDEELDKLDEHPPPLAPVEGEPLPEDTGAP